MAQITLPAEIVVKAAQAAIDDIDNKYPLPDDYEKCKWLAENLNELSGRKYIISEHLTDEDMENEYSKLVDKLKAEYKTLPFYKKIIARGEEGYVNINNTHDRKAEAIRNLCWSVIREKVFIDKVEKLSSSQVRLTSKFKYADIESKIKQNTDGLTLMLTYTGQVTLNDDEYALIKDYVDTGTNSG